MGQACMSAYPILSTLISAETSELDHVKQGTGGSSLSISTFVKCRYYKNIVCMVGEGVNGSALLFYPLLTVFKPVLHIISIEIVYNSTSRAVKQATVLHSPWFIHV